MDEKKKYARYIAGGLFLLSSILFVIIYTRITSNYLIGYYSFANMLYRGEFLFISGLIIGVGLIFNKKSVMLIGASAGILLGMVALLRFITLAGGFHLAERLDSLYYLCNPLYWAFLFPVILAQSKKVSAFGFVSAIIAIVGWVFVCGQYLSGLSHIGFFTLHLDMIVSALAAVALTLALCFAFTVREKTVGNNSMDVSDRLLELKELLENGIITQEEFDEKKRQLIGL